MDYDLWISAKGELRSDPETAPYEAQLALQLVRGQSPMALTTSVDDRDRLIALYNNRRVLIEPAAKRAIKEALEESKTIPPPLLPPTDYELVAYLDEIKEVKARVDIREDNLWLTKGKWYNMKRGSVKYKEPFTRKKAHFDEKLNESYTLEHDMELHGRDSAFIFYDDRGHMKTFRGHYRPGALQELDEAKIWDYFEKPHVPSIGEKFPDRFSDNRKDLKLQEFLSGEFTWYPAQMDYVCSVACTDSALVSAETGAGKSAMAIGLMALKSAVRTMLVAPKGTVKDADGTDNEYDPAQWIGEFKKFAPDIAVYKLFSRDDYIRLKGANGGELPPGVYVTYDHAMFRTGAMEGTPKSWGKNKEGRLRKHLKLKEWTPGEPRYSDGIGAVVKNSRCVVSPSLSTIIQADHTTNCIKKGEPVTEAWDMVILDEAHLICNLEAQITEAIIKLQPKYKYCLTATPIPNMIWNIFSLMGWLCVPDWYKGGRMNPRWPYSLEMQSRFRRTFVSYEHDITQTEINKKNGMGPSATKPSPIISEPTRLLKLLKPTLAFISKEQCNPDLQPCEVIDVRVPMGEMQKHLYTHWLDLKNYDVKTAFRRYGVQLQYLRGVCAAPCDGKHARSWVDSAFNPKMVAILEKVWDCLERDEQVTIVYARQAMGVELSTRLDECGVAASKIDGTVRDHAREAALFKRGDTRVMLMGINCAQSYSFQQCPNLIVGSLEWSYGKFSQAKGRVWRLNSPGPVRVYVILHKDSIEGAMFDKLANKEDTATICLYGKRVPNGTVTMTPQEILAEHLFDWDNMQDPDATISEEECEEQWAELREKIKNTQLEIA